MKKSTSSSGKHPSVRDEVNQGSQQGKRGRPDRKGRVVKLVRLCAQIASARDESDDVMEVELEQWESEFGLLMESCIAKNDTQLLIDALDRLLAEEKKEAADLLLSAAEYQSCHLVSSDQRQLTWLIALPVSICLFSEETVFSRDIRKLDEFTGFVKTIRGSGLLDEEPSIVLYPYLFSANELMNMTYGEVRRLCRNMESRIRGMDAVDAEFLICGSEIPYESHESDVYYLIGAVSSSQIRFPFSAEMPVDFSGEDDASEEEFFRQMDIVEQKISNWCELYAEPLQAVIEGLPQESALLWLGRPNLFYSAVRDGMSDFADFCFTQNLTEIMEEIAAMSSDIDEIRTKLGLEQGGELDDELSLVLNVEALGDHGCKEYSISRVVFPFEEPQPLLESIREAIEEAMDEVGSLNKEVVMKTIH